MRQIQGVGSPQVWYANLRFGRGRRPVPQTCVALLRPIDKTLSIIVNCR